jgi:hypothetical protein
LVLQQPSIQRDLKYISSGCTTVRKCVIMINGDGVEDAPQLTHVHIRVSQLGVPHVVFPNQKVVVPPCHELVIAVVEEFDGVSEAVVSRAAANGPTSLDIPQDQSIVIGASQ